MPDAMNEQYIVCRPGEERCEGMEVAATFRNKDLADRELDRLNALRQPWAQEWHLVIRQER